MRAGRRGANLDFRRVRAITTTDSGAASQYGRSVAVTSASTITEIEADIVDNGDYDLVGSTSKAKLFVHACRAWLVKQAQFQSHAGAVLSYSVDQVRQQLDAAIGWLKGRADFTAGQSEIGTSFVDLSEAGL